MNLSHANLTTALDQASKLFFLEMGEKNTAYVYGSAALGAWTSARSDLDLLILLKQAEFPYFQMQLKKWKGLGLPSLDGFVCFEDTPDLFALRLDDLGDGRQDLLRPLIERILPPDLWKIQFRSKKLFGSNTSIERLAKLTRQDLQGWAISNRDTYWLPIILEGIPIQSRGNQESPVPLTPTIWVASGAARIANLIKGGECISKQEALELFIHYLPKSKNVMRFLLKNYECSDEEATKFKAREALEVSHLCLELLKQA